jgi:hypothetical protein
MHDDIPRLQLGTMHFEVPAYIATCAQGFFSYMFGDMLLLLAHSDGFIMFISYFRKSFLLGHLMR